MTPEEITRLENSLAVQLPEFYRTFLLDYPADLAGTYTYFSANHRHYVARFQLNDCASEIVELNQDVRRPGTPWTKEDGAWPDRYFVIGHDSCGGYFAIDLLSGSESVFYYDHETGRFTPEHKSIPIFAAHLVTEAVEWNAEHEPTVSKGQHPPASDPVDPNQLSLL